MILCRYARRVRRFFSRDSGTGTLEAELGGKVELFGESPGAGDARPDGCGEFP